MTSAAPSLSTVSERHLSPAMASDGEDPYAYLNTPIIQTFGAPSHPALAAFSLAASARAHVPRG